MFCMVVSLLLPVAGSGQESPLYTGFNVKNISAHTKDNVVYLGANIDYSFSEVVLEAIRNGIPISILLQIRLIEKRTLLWDKTLVDINNHYQLQYHALTRQYLLKNISAGTQQNFITLQLTLSSLGTISDLPLVNSEYLSTDRHYYVHISPYIDIESLPSPLRPVAYITPEWQFSGKWYIWPLKN